MCQNWKDDLKAVLNGKRISGGTVNTPAKAGAGHSLCAEAAHKPSLQILTGLQEQDQPHGG